MPKREQKIDELLYYSAVRAPSLFFLTTLLLTPLFCIGWTLLAFTALYSVTPRGALSRKNEAKPVSRCRRDMLWCSVIPTLTQEPAQAL